MIRIVEYTPRWRGEILVLAADLRALLGDVALRIDHIGSTSVVPATCFIQCDDRPYERLPVHDYLDEKDEIHERMTQVAGTTWWPRRFRLMAYADC